MTQATARTDRDFPLSETEFFRGSRRQIMFVRGADGKSTARAEAGWSRDAGTRKVGDAGVPATIASPATKARITAHARAVSGSPNCSRSCRRGKGLSSVRAERDARRETPNVLSSHRELSLSVNRCASAVFRSDGRCAVTVPSVCIFSEDGSRRVDVLVTLREPNAADCPE